MTRTDSQVREIWRQAAEGEITVDQAGRLVHGELVDDAERLVADFARLDGSARRKVLARIGAGQKPARRRKADEDPHRRGRLVARKRLGADILPPALVGDLTVSDRAVAAIVARACRMGKCTLSIGSIAEAAGVSERTVQLALRKLEERELIATWRRPVKGAKNLTNMIAITSPAWREHLKERAALARIHRVKKLAPERGEQVLLLDSTAKSGAAEAPERPRAGGMASATAGASRPIWATPSAKAWLRPFLEAAGGTLNPAAIALQDPLPLTRILNRGIDREAVLDGIAAVRRRHDGAGRKGEVWSWSYFTGAIAEAACKTSDRRRLAT